MSQPRTSALFASLVVLGGVLAACGSSGGGTGSVATTGASTRTTSTTAAPKVVPSACKIVTATAVTAILGTVPATPPTTDTATQCSYAGPTGGNYVNVTVETGQSASTFTAAASAGGATQPVSGLGDQAFQSASGDSVFVLKGGTSLRIDVFSNATPLAVFLLARTATAKLPS